ncbi:hypothetical protein VTN96DRAFT_7553 [Rasamsonia emersonii]|uniref:Short-chain oxidoreductase n=1 Tax=Rasamsonia emersonii (strain ATCC 16479 / CBS 393.64 / IMI 116815) TaxID=1408163 RepID=A0A0F4Z450_RASE3|nr:hypothetical protein T310_0621 [Rasamsonia emersonii CBS 393.64]KKA25304.1 hypothetical protein T310_0621 [Rasamsonia emersonii CBS 393.64]
MSTTHTIPKRPLTWLITGCSSGFGLSLTRIAQAHGHTVIATSRNPSRTPDLVQEVENKGGKWLQLDVDDPSRGAQVIEDLEASGQPIDVLVNNAGYSIYTAGECFTEEEVRQQMETLYFGPFRLIRAAVPHMRKRRFGVVVNFSSGAALEGRDSMGAYAASKAALDGLSKVLAKEVAPFNVRILTVALGTFNTNMGNATIIGKNPLPEDYRGSVAQQMMDYMSSGKFEGNGDKDKAMKAVYEVVTGEGVGAGHLDERLLPLGRDLDARIKQVQAYLAHSLEVFGEVCNNVHREK